MSRQVWQPFIVVAGIALAVFNLPNGVETAAKWIPMLKGVNADVIAFAGRVAGTFPASPSSVWGLAVYWPFYLSIAIGMLTVFPTVVILKYFLSRSWIFSTWAPGALLLPIIVLGDSYIYADMAHISLFSAIFHSWYGKYFHSGDPKMFMARSMIQSALICLGGSVFLLMYVHRARRVHEKAASSEG